MFDLRLPTDVIVRGELSDRKEAPILTQDILEVELSNGLIIDVGWYPEHDPAGCYWICVFHQDWENQLIDPIHRQEPDEVKQVVEELAQRYQAHLVSESSTT